MIFCDRYSPQAGSSTAVGVLSDHQHYAIIRSLSEVFGVAILTVVAEQCYDCCILCCAEVECICMLFVHDRSVASIF